MSVSIKVAVLTALHLDDKLPDSSGEKMLWLSLSIANTAQTDLRLRGRGGVHTAGSGD